MEYKFKKQIIQQYWDSWSEEEKQTALDSHNDALESGSVDMDLEQWLTFLLEADLHFEDLGEDSEDYFAFDLDEAEF